MSLAGQKIKILSNHTLISVKEIESKINSYLSKLNIMNTQVTSTQVNFVIASPKFNATVGGVIALFNLARIIHSNNIPCKIFDLNRCDLPNKIFNIYATESDIDSNTIVVYPEVIVGNPLNAKHVIRWILCEVGINCPHNIYETWSKDDFVYHYCTYNPDKDINNYNLLSPLLISSKFKNQGKQREGYCHIIRKAHKFHQSLECIHPNDSLLLADDLSEETLIHILNTKEYLISYDPYSYISTIAALCGCISILAPMKNVSKDQWFKTMSTSKILGKLGEKEFKGIAYGLEEIEYARNTLHETRRQQEFCADHGNHSVKLLINDMKCIFENTAEGQIASRNNSVLRVSDVFYSKELVLFEDSNNSQELRQQIAGELLNCTDQQLFNQYQGELGKIFRKSITNRNKYKCTSEQKQILNDNLDIAFSQPKVLQSLMVAMLYCHANHLSIPCDLSIIPDWLVADYLNYLFPNTVNFYSLEESENYYGYMHKWVYYLHDAILSHPDDPFWHKVVNVFAQTTSFIPAYFNDFNLKELYTKRAEIIEFFLKINKYETDYEFEPRPANQKKIRLGILASHYSPSAETFAALPAYEYLSREFEVILYSLQTTNHPLEEYCRSCANHSKLLPTNLADQVNIIRADDLDILFFVTNVTAITNQISLLASHRLARIQATSGGSVVTTGMSKMDYFISGTLTDTSSTAQEQYREQLIQLTGAAHCFSYGNDATKSTVTIDRESLRISTNTVIFTSGANFFKIVPELIHTWAKIVSQVPNSALMLLPYGPNWSNSYPKQAFENNLAQIFAQYGMATDRLIVLDPQPIPNREDVKEYYKLADICLDSYPFSGTTSLIEPLQVGLPVISRQGNSFRSAMGAAMIQSLDIADLVADSEETYIQLAVNLGNNPELRQQKSAEVQAKMQDNPSFLDSRAYSAKIGDLFIDLYEQYNKNAQHESLQLRDVNLMVFPDWNQSEESVGADLQQVIQTLATQPNAQNTTLLIDTTNIPIEDAQMFLSSVAMNLMMEEDIDITEELGISLIEDLNNIQWENLLPRINSRIVMGCDDQKTVQNLLPENLAQRQIESFVLS
jgi:predicted O-linked N-acetylglucosamine transferase (SPINDLY family)